ncbi:hypothetical protein MLTONO_0458 [Mesorhizobium loti]|nr:hypothetical protein MLTONO_0458 [Mesorhizobium loti]
MRTKGAQAQGMTDKPATTYIVSVFDKAHLRAILTNKDEGEALALERAMIQDGAGRANPAEDEEAARAFAVTTS